MIKKVVWLAIILSLVLTVVCPAGIQVAAQGPGQITVSNSTAQMSFPLTLNFSAMAKSNINITDIRLRYQVEQASFAQVTSEVFIPVNPSSTVNVKYGLDMKKVGGLPPGTYVDYWWVAKDASGSRLETSPVQYQITDNRYKWQNISQGKINLYWYQGDNSFAQSLMSAAQQALVKLASNTGATPSKTVNLYIYASAQDLQGALIYPNEWTGGVAFVQYNNVAIGISPSNLAWGQTTVTHELTHIVIFQVTFNPFSGLPVWFNEGLAMYNQGALDSQFTAPLNQAINSNSLISVRSISSPFSANSAKANLSYAEAYALIDYLLKQYGPTKMQALLDNFKQGNTYDGAFKAVYGFNLDGLNSQWMTWIKTQKY
ncbi:MAG TPA: peptidase MA family metallohydrolase [Dehalococcoidales bacterium]